MGESHSGVQNQEWTNVWDPGYTSNFRRLYDVTSTPIIYILDKNKKIIAKRLDVDSSLKFLKAQLILNKATQATHR